jgi:hypothetical protein
VFYPVRPVPKDKTSTTDNIEDKTSTTDNMKDMELRDHMPWRGTTVLITKQHQHKGKPMVVCTVLPKQDTPSGLRLEIKPVHYDPNAPFKKAIFDYDDVVEYAYVIN